MSVVSSAATTDAPNIDWLVPGTSFPRMIKCLSLDSYRTSALIGEVIIDVMIIFLSVVVVVVLWACCSRPGT